MVLISTLALMGCLKQPAAVQAPEPMDATVVGVLDPQDRAVVTALPPRVQERLTKLLAARNITAKPLPLSEYERAFGARRVTVQRMVWLGEQHPETPLLVLVEAEAEYYSQIEGRNRWTVHVTATVGAPDKPEELLTNTFDVPVILQFVHEKEDRALEEAAPLIERKLGHLVDQYLSALAPH